MLRSRLTSPVPMSGRRMRLMSCQWNKCCVGARTHDLRIKGSNHSTTTPSTCLLMVIDSSLNRYYNQDPTTCNRPRDKLRTLFWQSDVVRFRLAKCLDRVQFSAIIIGLRLGIMLCPEFKVRKLVNVTNEMSAGQLVVASHASYLWFALFYRKFKAY